MCVSVFQRVLSPVATQRGKREPTRRRQRIRSSQQERSTCDIRTSERLGGEGEGLPEWGHIGGPFSQVAKGSSSWTWTWTCGSEPSEVRSFLQPVACVDNKGKTFFIGGIRHPQTSKIWFVAVSMWRQLQVVALPSHFYCPLTDYQRAGLVRQLLSSEANVRCSYAFGRLSFLHYFFLFF